MTYDFLADMRRRKARKPMEFETYIHGSGQGLRWVEAWTPREAAVNRLGRDQSSLKMGQTVQVRISRQNDAKTWRVYPGGLGPRILCDHDEKPFAFRTGDSGPSSPRLKKFRGLEY